MTPKERKGKEKRIKEHLKSQGVVGIQYMQIEQTFTDLDDMINVWNVKTKKDSWWVVESEVLPLNLYTQGAYFFSADEAYSFHIGITNRLDVSYRKTFKHILNEIPLDIERIKSIKRKLNSAAEQLNDAIEPEHFQAIGLTCRECLLDLGKELIKRNKKLLEGKNIKDADFKNIANLFIDHYIPGKSNASLRSYARRIVEIGWSYSSEIVHSPNRNFPDIKINILFVSTIVSLFENMFLKFLGFDNDSGCKQCSSNDYNVLSSNNENQLLFHCNSCGYEQLIDVKVVEMGAESGDH